MSKIMDYVVQLVLDESFRYPGAMERNLMPENTTDPMLWPHGILFSYTPKEMYTLNLKKL
jgi:hypothetical protein